MAKILVTGATGFVGQTLIPELIANGHEVRCAVNQKSDRLLSEQIVVERLEQTIDWSQALHGIDIVIHLAARVHIMKDKAVSPLDEFCKVNSIATNHLAEQAAQKGVKRFVLISSIKVNGEHTLENDPFTEEAPEQPKDPYGYSKLYAEQNVIAISHRSQMQFVILRPPLIYGPGVKANFLKLLQIVNKGWPLPFAGMKNKRSFVFIDNFVSAICAVSVDPKAANQVYLVADDESWSLSLLLTQLAKEFNIRLNLFHVPGILLMTQLPVINKWAKRLFGALEVSNNKLKSQLGWVPPVSSVEGLARTVKWYKDEYNS